MPQKRPAKTDPALKTSKNHTTPKTNPVKNEKRTNRDISTALCEDINTLFDVLQKRDIAYFCPHSGPIAQLVRVADS